MSSPSIYDDYKAWKSAMGVEDLPRQGKLRLGDLSPIRLAPWVCPGLRRLGQRVLALLAVAVDKALQPIRIIGGDGGRQGLGEIQRRRGRDQVGADLRVQLSAAFSGWFSEQLTSDDESATGAKP